MMKFDELNVMWIGQMELSAEEKLVRIEMISAFETELNKVFPSMRQRAEEDKERFTLFSAVYSAIISSVFIQLVNEYFRRCVNLHTDKTGDISDYSRKWLEMRSQQLSKEILYTTQNYVDNNRLDNAFSQSRARTISRTEINSLCECAALEGYYQSGYTQKKWKSFKDEKTRETHRTADGQIRNLFEPFSVGDSLLMFPQDSSLGASAKEIVNCRCIMLPVI
ncbi:MAG: phage minor head protein [Ruminococcus sp.]|nr:phage minor head protein [Ruminococcus sp.]